MRAFPAFAVLITTLAAALLYLAAGDTLGAWLGGFAVIALVLPGLAVRRESFWHRTLDAAAGVDVVVLGWMGVTMLGGASMGSWLTVSILLCCFAAALMGVVWLMDAGRIPVGLAVFVTSMGAVAWLASPVGLSRWMDDRIAGFLGRFHPLLAANGQLTRLGIWLEQPRVYRHAVLGQDVPYTLPATVWPSAGAHLLVGVVAILMVWAISRAWPRPGGCLGGWSIPANPEEASGVESRGADR